MSSAAFNREYFPGLPEAFLRLLVTALAAIDYPDSCGFSEFDRCEDDLDVSVWLVLLELEGCKQGAL